MSFSGQKTQNIVSTITNSFNIALDLIESLLSVDPQDKERLRQANETIQRLQVQLADTDESVASLLSPLLEKAQTLIEKAHSIPPESVPDIGTLPSSDVSDIGVTPPLNI